MRLSVATIADGLIRALRTLAHDLADDRESGYASRPVRGERRPDPNSIRRDEESGDDRRGG